MSRFIYSRYVRRRKLADVDHPYRQAVFQELQAVASELASKHILDSRQAEYARVAVCRIRVVNLGRFNLQEAHCYRHHRYSELAIMSGRKRLIFPVNELYGIGIDANGSLYHKVSRRDRKYENDVHFWIPLNSAADAPHMTDVLSGSVMQSLASLISG